MCTLTLREVSCLTCSPACVGVRPGMCVLTPCHTLNTGHMGLWTPAHTCAHSTYTGGARTTRVHTHACTRVLANTAHTADKNMRVHVLSRPASVRTQETKGKETTWPMAELKLPIPWGRGLGEQGEGGSTESWGRERGWGERFWWNQMVVGAARAPEAQGREEEVGLAQQPGSWLPYPAPQCPRCGLRPHPTLGLGAESRASS